MDYEEYLRSFNSVSDMAGLLEHYAPDAVIEGPRGITSLDDFLVQLRDARDGVRVTAVPRTVLGDEGRLMAELDITYAAERDRPDHPVVPLRAGESAVMRFFVVYELRDGKVARFARAFWRVG
jgi:ketosteroid isomerase-like protein